MSAETTKTMIAEHPAHCRTCGAEILWLRNDRTKRVAPIDAQPSLNGNIEITEAGEYHVFGEPTLFDQRQTSEPVLHLNHWVTCTRPPEKS